MPDIDVVVQWKLPATLSNFIQRAGRAVRGRVRTGIAVLLVERSAYSIDIQTPAGVESAPTAPQAKRAKGRSRGKVTTARKSGPKGHADLHGVKRGNSTGTCDGPLNKINQPRIDQEAADEGLLAFVQSTQCRRQVWREVYECPPSGID